MFEVWRPTASSRHSPDHRTVFGADELLYVLEGRDGDRQPRDGRGAATYEAGESVFLPTATPGTTRSRTATTQLRVLELFAPPPATGSSGAYSRTQPYLDGRSLRRRQSAARGSSQSTAQPTGHDAARSLERRDAVWRRDLGVLVGPAREHRGTSRPGLLEVDPGQSGRAALRMRGDESSMSPQGGRSTCAPGTAREVPRVRAPSSEDDAWLVPSGCEHEYRNYGGTTCAAPSPRRRADLPPVGSPTAMAAASPIPTRCWTSVSQPSRAMSCSSTCTRVVAGPKVHASRGGPVPRVQRHSERPAPASCLGRDHGGRRHLRRPAAFANGNTLDAAGRLITCEHGSRSVTRTELDGSLTVLADRFEGKRFNSPNDAVVARDAHSGSPTPRTGSTATTRGIGRRARSAAVRAVYRLAAGARECHKVRTISSGRTASRSRPTSASLRVRQRGTVPARVRGRARWRALGRRGLRNLHGGVVRWAARGRGRSRLGRRRRRRALLRSGRHAARQDPRTRGGGQRRLRRGAAQPPLHRGLAPRCTRSASPRAACLRRT